MVIDKSKLRRFCRNTDRLMLGAATHTYKTSAHKRDLTVVTCFYPERVGDTEILMMRRTSPCNALPTGAWVVHFDSAVKFLKYIREANNGQPDT